MKNKFIFLAVFMAALLPAVICAGGWQDKRHITVTGDAEIKVIPDQIVITFGVLTESKDVAAAKKSNDDKVKKVLDLAAKYKIDQKDIQTDYTNISPKYRYDKYTEIIGYTVTKNIVVTLHDASLYESFLSDAVQSGVNYVSNVEFKTSELRKYRDMARAAAIKAAKEKATALAKELGQSIGQPLTIDEQSSSWYDWGGLYNASIPAQNSMQSGQAGGESENSSSEGSTIALGRIKVTAHISVVFELK